MAVSELVHSPFHRLLKPQSRVKVEGGDADKPEFRAGLV